MGEKSEIKSASLVGLILFAGELSVIALSLSGQKTGRQGSTEDRGSELPAHVK